MIWRIRDRDVFRQLAADGRRARAGVLWCTFLLDPSASPPRVAFAIGRAIGPAVVRNRVRRRLRVLLDEAALPPGSYLVGGRAAIGERTFDELRIDVVSIAAAVRRSPSLSTGSTHTSASSAG